METSPVFSINPNNPAAGAQFVFSLSFTARLKAITAVFTASAVGGNRYPYFYINIQGLTIAYTPLPPSAVTATASYVISAYPGAPLTNSPVADGIMTLPIPDLVLPASAAIVSNCIGMLAGDQWSAIELSFAMS